MLIFCDLFLDYEHTAFAHLLSILVEKSKNMHNYISKHARVCNITHTLAIYSYNPTVTLSRIHVHSSQSCTFVHFLHVSSPHSCIIVFFLTRIYNLPLQCHNKDSNSARKG